MTREEARKHMMLWVYSLDDMPPKQVVEALAMAADALRSVSREQAEKAWRAKWIDAHPRTRSCKCTRCNSVQEFETDFCSSCGASMTDEAVEMVMERVEDMLSKE